ncbi:MAG TPA: alternative ribosome rescue aminoacyl-tRNA hydrolase ArfB [Gemmatimonadaceae bacterium]|nr:alternative ribosome rescue aminoacyl-tRNA hydrolase ArfB [Gemmatimonadaceae bacterium]
MNDALVITPDVSIPRSELTVRATRSGGPGGQHVNTSSTRVELVWNVRTTSALNDENRARLLTRLSHRVDSEGAVRVVAGATRSQRRNRDDAEERLVALVRRALATPRKRIPTRASRAAKEARLTAKRRRGETKKARRPMDEES